MGTLTDIQSTYPQLALLTEKENVLLLLREVLTPVPYLSFHKIFTIIQITSDLTIALSLLITSNLTMNSKTFM